MPRETCSQCFRPPSLCYCHALVQITNTTKVVIIQHPLEEKHPFNTGRIAQLCLTNCEFIVAETLAGNELTKILNVPSVLLYPSLEWLPKVAEINNDPQLALKTIQQLIVIDANWKKSKKILHLHPQLQQLPRINLDGDCHSLYAIRKTSMQNGLSTLESIVKAMNLLEATTKFQPMLKPFEQMIALQQASQFQHNKLNKN